MNSVDLYNAFEVGLWLVMAGIVSVLCWQAPQRRTKLEAGNWSSAASGICRQRRGRILYRRVVAAMVAAVLERSLPVWIDWRWHCILDAK